MVSYIELRFSGRLKGSILAAAWGQTRESFYVRSGFGGYDAPLCLLPRNPAIIHALLKILTGAA